MYVAKQVYGCKPSRKHIDDLTYSLDPGAVPTQPVLSWRSQCATPYNQGQTGSCTGQSMSGVIQLRRTLQGLPNMASHPSQFFLYANARLVEGTLGQDAGASIRDVVTQAIVKGYCDNTVWDSNNPSNLLLLPDTAAYAAAKPDEGSTFTWIEQTGEALVAALKTQLANKEPVEFGITVYQSFEDGQTDATGIVTIPQSGEQILGGHALKMIGWSMELPGHVGQLYFEVENSWGTSVGDRGFYWFPAAYIMNPRLASEFAAMQRAA